jgi:hypothetical protein
VRGGQLRAGRGAQRRRAGGCRALIEPAQKHWGKGAAGHLGGTGCVPGLRSGRWYLSGTNRARPRSPREHRAYRWTHKL